MKISHELRPQELFENFRILCHAIILQNDVAGLATLFAQTPVVSMTTRLITYNINGLWLPV